MGKCEMLTESVMTSLLSMQFNISVVEYGMINRVTGFSTLIAQNAMQGNFYRSQAGLNIMHACSKLRVMN